MTQVSLDCAAIVIWIMQTSVTKLTCTRAKSSLAKFPEVSPATSFSSSFLNTMRDNIFSLDNSEVSHSTTFKRKKSYDGWREVGQYLNGEAESDNGSLLPRDFIHITTHFKPFMRMSGIFWTYTPCRPSWLSPAHHCCVSIKSQSVFLHLFPSPERETHLFFF